MSQMDPIRGMTLDPERIGAPLSAGSVLDEPDPSRKRHGWQPQQQTLLLSEASKELNL